MSVGEKLENPAVKEYINELCKAGLVKDPNDLTDQEKSMILEGCDHVLETYKKCREQTDEHESS